MGSLFEELEAREATARTRVEELEAELAEVSGRLSAAREGLERLRIARETVAEVLAEMTPEKPEVAVDADRSSALDSCVAGPQQLQHEVELRAGRLRAARGVDVDVAPLHSVPQECVDLTIGILVRGRDPRVAEEYASESTGRTVRRR